MGPLKIFLIAYFSENYGPQQNWPESLPPHILLIFIIYFFRESRASFKFNNWEERIEGLLGQLPIKNDKIVLGNTPFPMRGEEYLGQEQINGVGGKILYIKYYIYIYIYLSFIYYNF